MKESIGFTFTLNFIIVFIFISFAVLIGIMCYSKAYKLNNRVINEIEKCEGFNSCAVSEINRVFSNIGYRSVSGECPRRDGINAISRSEYPAGLDNYDYCIYFEKGNPEFDYEKDGDRYYRYGVLTYIYVEWPLLDLQVPVYTKTNWIYDFEGNS